jgi:hypothetical protein
MDLTEAIRLLVPLQLRVPNPRRPLELDTRCAAEVFLVQTAHGKAVIWVEPFWCDQLDQPVARISYAEPIRSGAADRWVDNDPRYGPGCLPYQKPFVMERLGKDSPAWRAYKAWQTWRATKGKVCGRRAAWQRVEQELGDVLERRLA